MDWIRVDVDILLDPDILAAGEHAFVLYVWGLTYSGMQETDGFIPIVALGLCPFIRSAESAAATLVARTLWAEVRDGYRIRGWDRKQPTKRDLAKRDAEREAARERMRRVRSRSPERSSNRSPDVRRTQAERSVTDVTLREREPNEHEDPGSDSLSKVGSSEGVQGEPDGFAADQDQGQDQAEDPATYGQLPDRAAYLWGKLRRSGHQWRETWPELPAYLLQAHGLEPLMQALEALSLMPANELAAIAKPRAYLTQATKNAVEELATNGSENGARSVRKRTAKAS